MNVLIGAIYLGVLVKIAPIQGQSSEPSDPIAKEYILMGPTTEHNAKHESSISCFILNLEEFFELQSVPQPLNKLRN